MVSKTFFYIEQTTGPLIYLVALYFSQNASILEFSMSFSNSFPPNSDSFCPSKKSILTEPLDMSLTKKYGPYCSQISVVTKWPILDPECSTIWTSLRMTFQQELGISDWTFKSTRDRKTFLKVRRTHRGCGWKCFRLRSCLSSLHPPSSPSFGSPPGRLPGWEPLAASQCLVLGID